MNAACSRTAPASGGAESQRTGSVFAKDAQQKLGPKGCASSHCAPLSVGGVVAFARQGPGVFSGCVMIWLRQADAEPNTP